MEYVKELVRKTHLDKGNHRATHHMNGRLFPFETREPERIKFKDPFIEIVGLVVRYSLGRNLIIEDIKEDYLDNIKEDIVIGENILESELKELFSFDFSNISTPEMLEYFPVINSNNKETVGKIRVAKYIVELFELRENNDWIEYISQTDKELSLYDKVVNNNLPDLKNEESSRSEKFVFFAKNQYLKYFNTDLSVLMKDHIFFMSNIDLLISYYLFYYIIQENMQVDLFERKNLDLWFAFDQERISQGRNAARYGYRLVLEKASETLINQDLIDYLNTLVGESDNFYSLEEIYNNQELREQTTKRLIKFNKKFAEVIESTSDYKPEKDFKVQTLQLKKYLIKSVTQATRSRYSRSFREFSRLEFIKSRGRIGYVLNLSQELLLLFVGVIIGPDNKMLVEQFFEELELRGIMLDAQSRKKVTSYFEDINILEKLSDSGDAQYVKSIL